MKLLIAISIALLLSQNGVLNVSVVQPNGSAGTDVPRQVYENMP